MWHHWQITFYLFPVFIHLITVGTQQRVNWYRIIIKLSCKEQQLFFQFVSNGTIVSSRNILISVKLYQFWLTCICNLITIDIDNLIRYEDMRNAYLYINQDFFHFLNIRFFKRVYFICQVYPATRHKNIKIIATINQRMVRKKIFLTKWLLHE